MIHIAVLLKPYLDLVLDGTKTIESRLTRQACDPFDAVEVGETIYFKQSAGPYRAMAIAEHVLFERDLTPERVDQLYLQYNDHICGELRYWKSKRTANFCTLIWLRDVQPTNEGPAIPSLQGRGWCVLDEEPAWRRRDIGEKSFSISITDGNLRNGTLYVTDVLDRFPTWTHGGNTRREAGTPITLALHGGPSVQTDIVAGRKLLRTRVWRKWFVQHEARAGDEVVFTPLDETTFLVGRAQPEFFMTINPTIRPYEKDRDLDDLRQVWKDIGWTKEDDTTSMDTAAEGCITTVAELDGHAQAFSMTAAGDMCYLRQRLPVCNVLGVGTSHIARQGGLAGRVTAASVARGVDAGAAVAALGIFDQGFYDRLGFGTLPPVRISRIDPAALMVDRPRRAPCRLTSDDWEEIHANRMRRPRRHGSLSIHEPLITRAETQRGSMPFGMGFRDAQTGALTHHLWIKPEDRGYGPYEIAWFSYETPKQALELFGLLKTLGDQVTSVRFMDPPGFHVQSLLEKPIRALRATKDSTHELRSDSLAFWQVRMCDVPRCVAATKLPGDTVRFNLDLSDPVVGHLDDESWRGVAGKYVITLGPESSAESGTDAALPTIRATVNAFTRLWLGVSPATCLVVTDELDAPPEVLDALDDVLRLPAPHLEWDI